MSSPFDLLFPNNLFYGWQKKKQARRKIIRVAIKGLLKEVTEVSARVEELQVSAVLYVYARSIIARVHVAVGCRDGGERMPLLPYILRNFPGCACAGGKSLACDYNNKQ